MVRVAILAALIVSAPMSCTCCDPPEPVTPVYVTVAGHIEESRALSEDCEKYTELREQLIDFAEVVRAGGFDFNLQAAYEWFVGVSDACEEDLWGETDGLNIVDYLVREYDFEIDVHQEGADIDDTVSGNNFADIRYVAGLVTGHITETTGFQWDNSIQYDSLQNGETGALHTGFTWWPQILSGGVSHLHTGVDGAPPDFSQDMTSIGGWIPSGFSADDFHTHDTSDDARMLYIGSGPNQHINDWGRMASCDFESTADFVRTVVEKIEDGTFPSGELYTTTLFVPQWVMTDPARHAMLSDIIDELAPLVDSGQVVYAHFTEVAEAWRTTYGSRPNIVQYDRFDPDDYTCEEEEE